MDGCRWNMYHVSMLRRSVQGCVTFAMVKNNNGKTRAWTEGDKERYRRTTVERSSIFLLIILVYP